MADNLTGRLSFQLFRQPLFLFCLFLYTLHLGLSQVGFTVPLLQYYLSDLLCMPLVLPVTLFLQRSIFGQSSQYVFSAYQVGLAVAYFSLMFEGILPHFMPRYTADALDVLAYSLGGLLYYRYLNKPGR